GLSREAQSGPGSLGRMDVAMEELSSPHKRLAQPIANLAHLLLALSLAWIGSGRIFAQETRPRPTVTLQYLERRKQQQEAAARERQAFFGFQLTNRVIESRIRFEHHIVDDAGKTYKAAHYDHGNALAVSDVDGDGFLDIYFTSQLG